LDKLREKHPDFYAKVHFIEIERSEFHREKQKIKLAEHLSKVSFWSPDLWKEQGKKSQTIIFSNELLDAFPVHRIRQKAGQLYELHVSWDDVKEIFYESEFTCEALPVMEYLQKEGIRLLENQMAEINLAANQWITEIAGWLEQGEIVTIDYGDVAEEIYAAHRMNGTLLCYKDHRAHDNPYIHIGEQDMTAHINFSACINAGVIGGIDKWKIQTQKEFLVQEGILELLQNDDSRDPFSPAAKRNRAIRQLLLGDQMSELFKVLQQTKG
jgi:SAM-dependent MidA family methyltransferase